MNAAYWDDEPRDKHHPLCAIWTSSRKPCSRLDTCRADDGHTDRSFQAGVDALVARFESYRVPAEADGAA